MALPVAFQSRVVGFVASGLALVSLALWLLGRMTWARGFGPGGDVVTAPWPAPFYSPQLLLASICVAAAVMVGVRALSMAAGASALALRVLRGSQLRLDQRGQAMTEFAVSFPIVLITTLILIQMALMFQAKNVVTYAAYAAARAAIVWIPAEADGEGKHAINIDGGDKMDKIHQAAAMACVPISPRASVVLDGLPIIGDIASEAFSAMSSMMSSLGLAGEYIDAGIQRYAMSHFATEVILYKATETGFEEQSGEVEWDWPDDADVGVEVRHRYYLPIPLVNRFIGDPWVLAGIPPFSINLPGRYTQVRAVAVFPLEGETGNPPISGFWD